ncbi:unnamed protein product [Owenia fusiformis]|uniref:DUF8077 domain-containing protein n=1 Tax=Owenia fusiformis TaxID=6347 RepID=A0A8J1XW86_OWEFU|nr:unnamed protein product [Owenia fusiformis]
MGLKLIFIVLALQICLFAVVRAQTAADKGKVMVQLPGISKEMFESTVHTNFKTAISRYVSQYCKPNPSNCRGSEKHIRPDDVMIIQAFEDESGRTLNVEFYIKDIHDEANPALTTHQLERCLENNLGKIRDNYGLHMILLATTANQALTPGAIAGISVCSVLVVIFIILAVCLVRRDTIRKRKELELLAEDPLEKDGNRLSRIYDNVEIPATNAESHVYLELQNEGGQNGTDGKIKRKPSDPYALVAAVEKQYENTDVAIESLPSANTANPANNFTL